MREIRCTGAVLLGGRSSRMGTPKHEMRLEDGRTMFDAVMAALSAICGRVVMVGATSPRDSRGSMELPDLRPGLGPLGGIEALLASGIDSQYLVCPCDVPLITPDLLRRLVQPGAALATVFQIEGRDVLDPLPARISAEALPIVRRLLDAGERSVWRVMQELRPEVVAITENQAMQLHNVNTPEEFEKAVKLMEGK